VVEAPDVARLEGLLGLAAMVGEAQLGDLIRVVPDRVPELAGGAADLIWTKTWLATSCTSAEALAYCRSLAFPSRIDWSRWPHVEPAYRARLELAERFDEAATAELVAKLQLGREKVFAFELQPIYESQHRPWFLNWVRSGEFLMSRADPNYSPSFPPRGLRPAAYVLPAVSHLLRGKPVDDMLKALPHFNAYLWANPDIGELAPDVARDDLPKLASYLMPRTRRPSIWHSDSDHRWEQASPILLRVRPDLAAEVVAAHVRGMASLDDPWYLATELSHGASTVVGRAEHQLLLSAFRGYLNRQPREEARAKASYILKAAVSAAPTRKEGREALASAPRNVFGFLTLAPLWNALGDRQLVRALAQRVETAQDPQELAGLLWGVYGCARAAPVLTRGLARRYILRESTEVRRATLGILHRTGRPQDARFVWDNLAALDLANRRGLPYGDYLLLRFAGRLAKRPVQELIGTLRLPTIGGLMDEWDDGCLAEAYACTVEAAIRRNTGSSLEPALDPGRETCVRDMQARSESAPNPGPEQYAFLKGFEFLYRHAAEWIERWVELVTTNGQVVFTNPGFAWALARVLLRHNDRRALEIVDACDPGCLTVVTEEGVDVLHAELCQSLDGPGFLSLAEKLILRADSDLRLFRWGLALRAAPSSQSDVIGQWLRSPSPMRRAFGVRLLGWSGGDCVGILERAVRDDQNAHVRQAAIWAVEDWWRERAAKHWYRRIYQARSAQEAWAAQELFRLVADRRACFWRAEIDQEFSAYRISWKTRYLLSEVWRDQETLGKDYETELEKTLFGHQIVWLHDAVCPWLRGRTPPSQRRLGFVWDHLDDGHHAIREFRGDEGSTNPE
jgi:hypothetical protein